MRAMAWWNRRPLLVRHLLGLVLGVAFVLVITGWFSAYHNYELATLGAYLCAIAGLTVLTGTNGQVSLGHAALMAIGGYTVALLQNHFSDSGVTGVWVLPLSLILGAVVTAIAGGDLRHRRRTASWPVSCRGDAGPRRRVAVRRLPLLRRVQG